MDLHRPVRTRSEKAEGPFDQAQSAAFSLVEGLGNLVPAGALPPLTFGWAAVFPDQDFVERSVGWAPGMVLDAGDCASAAALETSLRRLVRYWKQKAEGTRRLLPDEVQAVWHRGEHADVDVPPVRGSMCGSRRSTESSSDMT